MHVSNELSRLKKTRDRDAHGLLVEGTRGGAVSHLIAGVGAVKVDKHWQHSGNFPNRLHHILEKDKVISNKLIHRLNVFTKSLKRWGEKDQERANAPPLKCTKWSSFWPFEPRDCVYVWHK